MQIAVVLSHLESFAPLAYQEDYDNAGLLTGDNQWDCKGILTTLDVTPDIVEEAIARKCNLIVAHHPLIFGGLKKITVRTHVGQALITAIRNDIAIYAIHTNLDNVPGGVNGKIADQLGLEKKGRSPLLPRKQTLKKLFCFVPLAQFDRVRQAVFAAGAGFIGNYSECSFGLEGTGTFKGGADTHPFVGEPGKLHEEKEVKLEVILPSHLSGSIIDAMIRAHPYEEPAYDLMDLANTHPGVGSGLIGQLPQEMPEKIFLETIKKTFNLEMIRHTPLKGSLVKRVAVCGGAGSFLISNALVAGADFFITADLKYHEFFRAEGRMVIADIGHFESEQFTVDLLYEILREKFLTFAVLKSEIKTNPVNYYI